MASETRDETKPRDKASTKVHVTTISMEATWVSNPVKGRSPREMNNEMGDKLDDVFKPNIVQILEEPIAAAQPAVCHDD